MLSLSCLHYKNPTATTLPTEITRYRGPPSLTENILKVF